MLPALAGLCESSGDEDLSFVTHQLVGKHFWDSQTTGAVTVTAGETEALRRWGTCPECGEELPSRVWPGTDASLSTPECVPLSGSGTSRGLSFHTCEQGW